MMGSRYFVKIVDIVLQVNFSMAEKRKMVLWGAACNIGFLVQMIYIKCNPGLDSKPQYQFS